MIEDTHSETFRLAAGLREMQRALDASRADAQARDSERRRLAREVDLLSHLLWSHEVDVSQLVTTGSQRTAERAAPGGPEASTLEPA